MITIEGPGFTQVQAETQPNLNGVLQLRSIGSAREKLVASAEGVQRERDIAIRDGASGGAQSANEKVSVTENSVRRVRTVTLADGRRLTETIVVERTAEDFRRTVVHDDGSGNAVVSTIDVPNESASPSSLTRVAVNQPSEGAEPHWLFLALRLAVPEGLPDDVGNVSDLSA